MKQRKTFRFALISVLLATVTGNEANAADSAISAVPRNPPLAEGVAAASKNPIDPAGRTPRSVSPVPGSQLYKPENLTRSQFRALPDDALIEYKGKITRKGELVAEFKRQGDELRARMEQDAQPSSLEALQAKLRSEEKAKIEAEYVAVRARIAAARKSTDANAPEVERLRRDIREALARAQPLSNADRVDLEKKLGELEERARRLRQ